jgi:hypothetical protein
MSIISITSFACTAAYLCDNGGGRRRYLRCVDFWRVLMLFGGAMKSMVHADIKRGFTGSLKSTQT